ncbi:Glycosyltransferase involved in cell wall bisynthesis [Lachnospiraceae bacterium KH1T2]|nr:Glycosyltransferase involved in cell wall bisynthesis [Lachnospiraceae bacterium KH1T2]
MEKLYIIVPAYNESENIENLINDWYPVVEKHNGEGESRLVVVNDGSKDNTYDKLCELAESRPMLKPMTKPNGGHGPTLLFGYRYAIENNADYIFQTDSDGQTDPAEFEQFWNLRNEYDAILGDRTARQDGASRKFVEDILLLILRLTFGVKISDSNAPFRLMKKELVEKYIKKMPEDFNLPNVMLSTYFAYFHEKLKFVEISFKPRQAGTNSINIKKIVKIGWKALKDFRDLKKHIND